MATHVSIVIVTYNSVDDIRGCLESVIAEIDASTDEIVVVDNASQDGTLDILYTIQQTYSPLKIISNDTNRYFAPAMNQALSAAAGKYVLLLNPDTIMHSGSLQTLVSTLDSDGVTGVVAPQLRNQDGSIQPSCRRFPKYRDVIFHLSGFNRIFSSSLLFNGWKMGGFDHASPRDVDQPQGAALLTSDEVLQTVGLLDEDFPMFFNDVDWCYRVKQHGYRIRFVPEAKVTHIRGASVNRAKFFMIISSHLSFFRFFEKHRDRIHQQAGNLLIGLLLFASLPVRIVVELITKNIRKRSLPPVRRSDSEGGK